MEVLLNILKCIELLACLVGFFYFKKLKNTYWAVFPFYLLFIVLAEYLGGYLRLQHKLLAANHFYNYLEIPVEFLFSFWLFYKAFKSTKYKWLPLACAITYLVSWAVDNAYLIGTRFAFYSFSYMIANVVMLVLLLFYFIQLVFSDAILTFRENMMFWVCLGMFIYYVGCFPYYGLRNTLAVNYPLLYMKYSYLEYILNCTMYLLFTFSFIWGKPNMRSL